MSLYENYIYSQFPENIDTYEYMQDITADSYELINQYQSLINQKKFNEAAQYLIEHPELDRSMFNAIKYNKLIDSIKSIETLYSTDVRKYILELMSFKGDYSNTTKYIKYNVVFYNSMVYLCISDCPLGTLPTNVEYWYPLSIKGDKGASGTGLSFEQTWSDKITYSKDSCVTYNNCMYASIEDNNLAHTPSKNSNYWCLVVDFNTVTSYDNSFSNLSATTMQNAIDEINTKVNTNTQNISINTNSISDINSRISNIDNTSDANKEVKYATTAGTCTGNSATATKAINADYATSANSAVDSDKVDGYHFMASTTVLTPNVSTLSSNTIYIQYE